MKLTELQIKKAQPKEKVYRLFDGHGLLHSISSYFRMMILRSNHMYLKINFYFK